MKFEEVKKELNLPEDTIAEKFYEAIVKFRIKEGLTRKQLENEIGIDLEKILDRKDDLNVKKPYKCATFYYHNKIKIKSLV